MAAEAEIETGGLEKARENVNPYQETRANQFLKLKRGERTMAAKYVEARILRPWRLMAAVARTPLDMEKNAGAWYGRT